MSNIYSNSNNLTKGQRILLQRRRVVRNRMIGLISSAIAILLVIFNLTSNKSFACNEDNKEMHKFFKCVEITTEQSVYDLADLYLNDSMMSQDRFVDEVMFINNLDSPEFSVAGKYIIIPYYDTFHS